MWDFCILSKVDIDRKSEDQDEVDQMHLEILDYLLKNEKVLLAFDLNKQGLYQALDGFQTERSGILKKQEFIEFIVFYEKNQPTSNENTLNKPEKSKKTMNFTRFQGKNIELDESLIETLRVIFSELDKFDDFIVKRHDFIKKLRQDTCVLSHLDSPISRLPLINKSYRLNEILMKIEKDADFQVISSKISKEYISWSEFYSFFSKFCWYSRMDFGKIFTNGVRKNRLKPCFLVST